MKFSPNLKLKPTKIQFVQANYQPHEYVKETVPLAPGATITANVVLPDNQLAVCLAILDTGCQYNLMGQHKLDELLSLSSIHAPQVQTQTPKLVTLGGHPVHITACHRFQISFSGQMVTPVTFHIVTDSTVDLLLGLDFMTQTGANINIQGNEVTLHQLKPEVLSRMNRNQESLELVNHDNINYVITKTKPVCVTMPHDPTGHTPVHSQAHPTSTPSTKEQCQSSISTNQGKIIDGHPLSPVEHKPFQVDTDFDSSQDKPYVKWDNLSLEHLNHEQRVQLQQVLKENEEAFVKSDGKLGHCKVASLKLQLKDPAQPPIKKQQYRIAPQILQEAQEQMNAYIRQGIIEEADSEFNSPILLLKKGVKKSHKHLPAAKSKTTTYRLVTDFRALNEAIVRNNYLLPPIDQLIDDIGNQYNTTEGPPKYFTSLDLSQAYFQLSLHEDSRKYTAFTWNNKKYQYTVCPMGISTSGGHCQQVVQKILQPYLGKCCVNYLDDILIVSRSFSQHMNDVQAVLQAFAKYNLLLSPSKCEFAKPNATFLGHNFSEQGYQPSNKHVSALQSYPRPQTVKELRTFLGLINYFRRFLQDRAKICEPLNTLTKKGVPFLWSKQCEESFQMIKDILCKPPILQYPRFNKRFYLSTDASTQAIGACLCQKDEHGNFVPIAYCGRSLKPHEKNYTVTKLELLATVFAIQYFQVYLAGQQFTLITDHSPLTSILKQKTLTPQLARFSLLIQSFDFTVEHQKGLLNSAADALSRREYQTDHTDVDDKIMAFPHWPQDQDTQFQDLEAMQNIHNHSTIALLKEAPNDEIRNLRKIQNNQLQKHSLIGIEDLTPSWQMLEQTADPVHDESTSIKSTTEQDVDQSEKEDKGIEQDEPNNKYNLRQRPTKIPKAIKQQSKIQKTRPKRQQSTEPMEQEVSEQHNSIHRPAESQIKMKAKESKSQPQEEKGTSHQQDEKQRSQPKAKTPHEAPMDEKTQGHKAEPPTATQERTNDEETDQHNDRAAHHDHDLRSKGFDHRFQDSEDTNQEIGQDQLKSKASLRNPQANQIDIEHIITEQKHDPLYGPLAQYLESGTLPQDPQLLKQVITLADYTLLHNEAIYRCPTQKTNRELRAYRLVIPQSCVPKILQMLHSDFPAQHFGILKTFHAARKRFYWPNMYRDIQTYIGSCTVCLENKRSQHRANPPMSLYDKVDIASMWHCDLLGPLPLTKTRNQYIAVCVDRFSRYLVTFPMKRKTQDQFFQGFFENVLCKHGVAAKLFTDRGREFCNTLFNTLCKTYKIEQSFTSGYHSQSNGIAERMIQNIVNLLRVTVNKAGSDWDKLLPQLTFQLNATVCKTTGFSPHFLMYGTNPRTFQLDTQILNDTDDQTSVEYINTIRQNQKVAWEAAAELTQQNQIKMKQYYDRDKANDKITAGSHVYLYRPTTELNAKSKFAPFYVGPFQCVKVLKNHRVQIRNLETGNLYPHPVHKSRLKPALHFKPTD